MPRKLIVCLIKAVFIHLTVEMSFHSIAKNEAFMQCIPRPSFQEMKQLKEQIREKELELERIKSQPDHEKDQEIHRLHSALAEKERCEATRAVLCSSLAEEADQLRVQLSSMVQMCQNLLIRLETGNDGGGTTTVVAPSAKAVCVMLGCVTVNPGLSVDFPLTLPPYVQASECDGVNIKMRKLQEENEQLKQRVAYVSLLWNKTCN